jgi:hypothetical protein
MTENPVSGREPEIMGDPEPEGQATDVMGGHQSGGDIMGGRRPEQRTDLLSGAPPGDQIAERPEPDAQRTDLMGDGQD